MTRLNVGVLGLSHDHVWSNLSALTGGDLGCLAAAAEPDPVLRERLRGLYGDTAVHASFDDLLDRRDLDAVFVFSDNRTSAELGVRALERRLPVMIEKPMAADLPGAEALMSAARRTRTPLMVNWPTAWRPALRHGLNMVMGGAVGEPIQLNHRGGHAGPREFGCSPQFSEWLYDPKRNGGGALIDYCGYGALLCRLVLGQPERVTAVTPAPRKPDLIAEDNAVAVLSYPKAIGLLEASWTQIGSEPGFAMVVYGERGTLIVHQPRATHESQRVGAGRVQLITPAGNRDIEPPPLPSDERDGPTHFLSCLRNGGEITDLCAADIGRDVQEIITAALLASAHRRVVGLPLD